MSEFRTLSLYGHVSKILVKIIINRIENKVENQIGLYLFDQFEFRKHKGTVSSFRILIGKQIKFSKDTYLLSS